MAILHYNIVVAAAKTTRSENLWPEPWPDPDLACFLYIIFATVFYDTA